MDDRTLIEGFADALWMERGLSRNTLAAYQSDLRAFAHWLAQERRRSLLAAEGISLLEVTERLLGEGVQQFADAYEKLMAAIAARVAAA